MLQGRKICKISLLILLILAFSAYGPYDYLGLYGKSKAVEAYLQDGEIVNLTGEIVHKEIKNDQTVFYVKNATAETAGGTLSNISFIFKFDSDYYPIKSKIKLQGRVSKFQTARNPGEFDIRDYYNSLGYYFSVTEPKIISVDGYEYFDILYNLNIAISRVYGEILSNEEAGFVSSITVGNKSMLDKDMQNRFQNAGLAHILAVSGLHVSVICMAIYRFLRKIGVGFVGSGISSGIVAITYGFLTGGSISSIRAIGMFLLYLLAQMLGECYDMLTAAGILALFLVVQNPLYIINSSFILSFGAVLGIHYIVIPFTKKNDYRFKSKILNYLVASFVFSFGISFALLPITSNTFYEFSTFGFILNMLVLPFMPLFLGLGIIGGIVGLFSIEVATIILYPVNFIIYYYQTLTNCFLVLPFSKTLVGKRGMVRLFLFYVLAIVALKYIKKFKLVIGAFIIISVIWIIPGKQEFQVNVLDVGQGDGIFITSEDGVNYFIDGGSSSKKELGKYTLLPFLKYNGVRHIDYWFLSHLDEDHTSGLLELLEQGYEVDNIVVSKALVNSEGGSEAFIQLKELADVLDAQIIEMEKYDTCGSKHLKFICVYPADNVDSDDVNELSLGLLMEYDSDLDGKRDFSGFFGGDISSEQERLIAREGLVQNVDLLKVSHHGSRFSSDSEFLQVLNPEIAVISCAKKNRYGHPSAEAVNRIHEVTENLYYTMDSGCIKISDSDINFYVGK